MSLKQEYCWAHRVESGRYRPKNQNGYGKMLCEHVELRGYLLVTVG